MKIAGPGDGNEPWAPLLAGGGVGGRGVCLGGRIPEPGLGTVLLDLPWATTIPESKGPGSTIFWFFFNCNMVTPTSPNLELLSVRPFSTFFNQPGLIRTMDGFLGKVSLSSAAALDARQANQYILKLKVSCGSGEETEQPLSVTVLRDDGPPVCTGLFDSPAGARVQVLETVAPESQLYTVLLRRDLGSSQRVSPAKGGRGELGFTERWSLVAEPQGKGLLNP
uniref:Cadherin domain-containing protein n=1 Tax=Ornithorhynchus anatinus TaxID=9258 RepID=F7EUF5_ORNAN